MLEFNKYGVYLAVSLEATKPMVDIRLCLLCIVAFCASVLVTAASARKG